MRWTLVCVPGEGCSICASDQVSQREEKGRVKSRLLGVEDGAGAELVVLRDERVAEDVHQEQEPEHQQPGRFRAAGHTDTSSCQTHRQKLLPDTRHHLLDTLTPVSRRTEKQQLAETQTPAAAGHMRNSS